MDVRTLLNAVSPDMVRTARALDLDSSPDVAILKAAAAFSRLAMQPHPSLFLRSLPATVAQLVARRILDPEGTTRRFVEASLRAIGPEPQETPATVDAPTPEDLEDHEGPEQGEGSPVTAPSPKGGGWEQPADATSPVWSGPAVLMVEEVAELLRVRPSTVRRLLRDGEIPGRKVGRDWRVRREELESYLRADR